MKRAFDGLPTWLLIGVIGWTGIIYIGWVLWQANPPKAGFDLALLLEAARRMMGGHSPYDPAMVAGTSPEATSLFYSYPPPVAQAMTLLAWLPNGVVLILWGLGGTLGLGVMAWRIARATGRSVVARDDAVKMVGIASLILPFALAVLFGNLDTWYGLAFGALVLAVGLGPGTRPRSIAGGIALGLVTVAKLHPASLLLWLLMRAVAHRQRPARETLTAAVVTGLVVVAISVAIGGLGPWQDYVSVVRAGAGATVVDPRNVGPVSLLGQVVQLDGSAVQLAQMAVAIVALMATALAALRVREPLASLAIAIAASLVLLPVTWYHYPVALIPVGVALAASKPALRARVTVAALIADLAIGFLPLLWVAMGLLLLPMREGAEAGRAPSER